ncbi:MAG: AMP-binding protein [Verrucomicrobiales bacterium]
MIANTDLRRVGELISPAVAAQIAATDPNRAAASPAFFFLALLRDRPDCLRLFWCSTPAARRRSFPVAPRMVISRPDAGVHAVYGSTGRNRSLPLPPPIWTRHARPHPQWCRSARRATCARNRPRHPAGPLGHAGRAADRRRNCPAQVAPARPEICVAGDHVLPGYLGGQGDAETKFRAGDRTWPRTGDAGYLDRSGALWLLGRCAARLPAAGDAPRYPLAIEAALSFYPEIKRAAALGIADQRVIVLETSERSKDWQAALSHLRAHRTVILDQIPLDRRHQAKIDYPALRALLQVAPMREPGNDPDAR